MGALALLATLALGFFSATWINAKEKKAVVGSAEAYHLIDQLVQSWVDYHKAPGIAVGVVSDQDIVHESYAGWANVEEKIKPNRFTLFSVCSISKLFTSVGMAKLQEEGKLGWDDPLSKHIPELEVNNTFASGPPITLRSILTHSSGLPREIGGDFWFGRGNGFPVLPIFWRNQKSERRPPFIR